MRRRGRETRDREGREGRRGGWRGQHMKRLVSEPQFLPRKDGWSPDELARVDHVPTLALDALVLLEDRGRDDEVVLPLVELEELQYLATA